MSRKPLDNPVWHALGGPQAAFAIRRPHARRYDLEIGPFFAIEAPSERAWRDCADIFGASREAWFVRTDEVPTPPGWTRNFAKAIAQMVLPPDVDLKPAESSIVELGPIIELGKGDLPAMRDLAARTRPGPFSTRTHELGTFLGIHEDGRLVAMAGERMRPPGWIEISDVATEPEYRGSGYARALIAAVAARIRASGQMPFLHTYADNATAIGVYKKMGFAQRATLTLTGLTLAAPES